MARLYNLLADIAKVDEVLFIVKSGGATAEIKSNALKIKQSETGVGWITLGSNDDPAHLHVNPEYVLRAEFVREQKPERISFSVRFYDESGERVLAAFFTRMYDESGCIIPWRERTYEQLRQKYDSQIAFEKTAAPPHETGRQ